MELVYTFGFLPAALCPYAPIHPGDYGAIMRISGFVGEIKEVVIMGPSAGIITNLWA